MCNRLAKFLAKLFLFFFNSTKKLNTAKYNFSNSFILFKCFFLALDNEMYIGVDGLLL